MSNEAQNLRAVRELKEMRALVKALSDEDWQIRLKAVADIPKQRKTAEMVDECVPALIKATRDKNQFVARAAIPALGDIGPQAKNAVDTLIYLLSDDEPLVRRSAAYSLGKIGPPALKSADNLVALLGDRDDEVRKAVSWSLGILGPEVVPLLNTAIDSENADVRSGCVYALGNIGPNAIGSLGKLIERLNDSEANIRFLAAKAIGNLRAAKETEKAVDPLKVALEDSDPDVRWAAAEALRKIGTNDAMDAWLHHDSDPTIADLCKQLTNDDKAVRTDAAENLVKSVTTEHSGFVNSIAVGLEDQLWKVRKACAEALAKIGAGAVEAVKPLKKCLNDENQYVRAAAATALGKIGPAAEDAVVRLIKHLKDESKEVRTACGLALELINTEEANKALAKFDWE